MGVYRIYKMKIIAGVSISAAAAVFIAICAFFLIRWFDFKKDCVSTEAVIVDIRSSYNSSNDSTDYDVTVEYIADGKIYRRPLEYYISSMREGQSVTIYYDPDDPYKIMNSPYLTCAILLIFILILGGVGTYFWLSEILNKRTINRLAAENKYIVCDDQVERYEGSSNITVNNVRYLQTDFIYHDSDGKEYVFSSRAYHPRKNPFADGRNVTIYVDIEKNPKKYYVHTDD